MDIETIKRGLRGEIIKRKNEKYLTCQTNIHDMCKDCLNAIEELEADNAKLMKLNNEADKKPRKCERCGDDFKIPQATIKIRHCINSELNISKGLCTKCAYDLLTWLTSKAVK